MTKEELFEKCLQIDFPQTTLTEETITRNYNALKNACPKPLGNNCIGVIQHFHPSLWQANRKGFVSPYGAWYDEDCLNKAIDNRLKYKGNDLTPIDIRAAFSVAKIAPKVSIFRPALAKHLIEKYLNEFEEVFDPCSGFSGRLLGAAALNKCYVGQEINAVTVKESNQLIEYLNLNNVSVTHKNSIATTGTYECLFTCPPYGDKENWNQDIECLSCDEWIDVCLKNYACKKYLFVVDKTEKYKDHIVEELHNKSHLLDNKEFVILV